MKESTGELSMVVVTLLAIALIAGVITILVPLAANYVNKTWSELTGTTTPPPDTSYVEVVEERIDM